VELWEDCVRRMLPEEDAATGGDGDS
jgi:hypothetical protein